MISLIIPYLLYSILSLNLKKKKKKKKKVYISLLPLNYAFLSFSFSSTALPPSQPSCRQMKKKKKATIAGCTMGFLITTIDKQILSATKFWRWSVLMPIPQPVIIDHQKYSILMFEMNENEKNWYLHPFFFLLNPRKFTPFSHLW